MAGPTTKKAGAGSRRRPRGEGSVIRVGDQWVVRVWVRGQRLQRTLASQREALAAIDELRGLAASRLSPARTTVADALDAFQRHGEVSRGWSRSTVRSYESASRLHIRPALGKKLLRDLSVGDVQGLLDHLLADRHSGRHVAHVRGVLRAALAHAMRQELVGRNVAALAASPPVRRPEMQALSAAQLARLFAALDGERTRPLLVTAANLGLRRGELIALRWSDVDLNRATLTVRRTGGRIGGDYVEGPPKTPRSRREIALPSTVVALLRAHHATIAAERLRLGHVWRNEDRVFPGEGGGPVGQTTIRKALDAALERAGLPHVPRPRPAAQCGDGAACCRGVAPRRARNARPHLLRVHSRSLRARA